MVKIYACKNATNMSITEINKVHANETAVAPPTVNCSFIKNTIAINPITTV